MKTKQERKTTNKKNKKGISLIVLVITIIVMIILAAAVIISLNNAGIIGKASDATVASDIAHIRTQADIVKVDAQLKAIENNEKLTQEKLIEEIQKHFKDSTVNGNTITVEKGRYDIVVEANLNLTIVQHVKYTGPVKDIEVTYTTIEEDGRIRVNLKVDLLNNKGYDECNEYAIESNLVAEFLQGLNLEEMFAKAAIMDGYADAKEYYEYEIQSELTNPISYNEFINSSSRDELVKESSEYETAEVWLKNKIARIRAVRDVNYRLTCVQKAKEIFPELKNKSFAEIKSIIENKYNNEKTFDQIIEDTIGDGNFDFWYNDINWWGAEEGNIYSKEQVALMCMYDIYAYEHPVKIQYPDGTEETDNFWTGVSLIDWWSFVATDFSSEIKVTSPTGYTETITVKLEDTTAPTVSIETTNITLNSVTVNVTATETGKLASGIKEYRYYIKGPSDADYVLKAKTTSTTYTYEGLTSDTEYEIVVGVEDNAGNIGKATVKQTTQAPKEIMVDLTIDGITLNSITVTASTEDEIKEYRYYIKGPNDADYVLKAKTLNTTYTYEGLTGGTEYEILVGVEDNAGNIGKASINKTLWITAMVDGVPIPKGFVASPYEGEKTKDGGLVIYELAENETAIPSSETEHTSKTTRNQYVWVPVEDFSKFVRGAYDNTTHNNTLGSSSYWEVILDLNTNMPDIEANKKQSSYMTVTTPSGGITNTLAEVQAMYESVKEYKGFYIARYEAGLEVKEAVEGSTDIGQRTEKGTSGSELPGIKAGTKVYSMMNKIPYNYIPWTWNDKMNEDTNGAVEVARRMYTESNTNYGVVSTLTYGVQWDRVLAWWVETKAQNGTKDVTISSNTQLNNSTNYGNYNNNAISTFNKGARVSKDYGQTYITITSGYSKTSSQSHLLTTGATEEARVNNIYDMAGNLWEWTMEGREPAFRILRGGYVNNNGGLGPVSSRLTYYPYAPSNADDLGFRSALYIKK